MQIDIRQKLESLNKRAKKIKENPELRHTASEHDTKKSLENTLLLYPHQYNAI